MTTFHRDQHVRPLLSPEDAIARELIPDHVARRDQLPCPALVLRRLAARPDPEPTTEQRPVRLA